MGFSGFRDYAVWNRVLHLPEYLFVGEWFIGIVVSLYLISPALLIYNIDIDSRQEMAGH